MIKRCFLFFLYYIDTLYVLISSDARHFIVAVPKKPYKYIYILYCYSHFFNISMSLLHHHHHVPQVYEFFLSLLVIVTAPRSSLNTLVPLIVCIYIYMASAASLFFIARKLGIALKSRVHIYVYVEATYHSNCSPCCLLHSSLFPSLSLFLVKYTQFIYACVRLILLKRLCVTTDCVLPLQNYRRQSLTNRKIVCSV
jgi:hypothetical protein